MICRLFIGLVIAGAVAVGLFAATHTPIYGPCTNTVDGKVCPLIGYK